MSFIKDFDNPLDPKGPSIRKISSIFTHYTQSSFIYDAIALMPVTMIMLPNHREKLLYILKCIRLKRGIENLDVLDYLNVYKAYVKNKMNKKIESKKKREEKIAMKLRQQGKEVKEEFSPLLED